MSLVGKVGRRRWRARLAMGVLYGLLILGALTTVYPFLLMVATGFKGPTDQNDNRLIPEYWQNREALVAKYVDDKYAGDASLITSTRGETSGDAERYRDYLENLPVEFWAAGFRPAANQVTSRLQMKYQDWLRQRYKGDIDALNRAYIEENTGFQTVVPPGELLERRTWNPPDSRRYSEWVEFKRTLPAEFRIPVRETRMYQEFVRTKYQNTFAAVPPEVAGTAKSFEGLALPKEGEPAYALAQEFRAKALPARYRTVTAEGIWASRSQQPADWMRATAQGRAKGYEPMPIEASEAAFVAAEAGPIQREFTTRNYRYVLDYMVLNGRALLNTAIFCLLVILAQLTVNPLAAYALSRFPIRHSGKILIFLLATMAFPAEVAMIPSFLLLKDAGLLNTFAALVLPTAASGYMIFLLKGFFDSLPQELFEAGQMDGAKETTMMLRIAFPLSKPVLGYLALLAFMGAYSAFLYAFLVAQDQRMWTVMVFIYQLQSTAPKAVMMAALALAALPTLAVFLLAQRVILRGIVLPGER